MNFKMNKKTFFNIFLIFFININVSLYAENELKISIKVELEKQSYMIGEPKWIKIIYKNTTSKNLNLNVAIESITTGNRNEFRTQKKLFLGSYLQNLNNLKVNGIYVQKVLIDEFILIDKPGTYKLNITANLFEKPIKNLLLKTKIIVVPNDDIKLNEMINKYVNNLFLNQNSNYENAKSLSVIRTTFAKEQVLKLIKTKFNVQQILFDNFIWLTKEEKNSRDRIAEILPYLKDTTLSTGMNYISEKPKKEYINNIKFFLNSKKENERCSALRTIVKFKDAKLFEILERMSNDKSKKVRDLSKKLKIDYFK